MNGKKIGGWIVRGGIAAVEDDMRQTYTVKHIRKGLTLLSSLSPLEVSKSIMKGNTENAVHYII